MTWARIVLAEAASPAGGAEIRRADCTGHTDHCQPRKSTRSCVRYRRNGAPPPCFRMPKPVFQSHMLDASELPLVMNRNSLALSAEECSKNEIILEVRCGSRVGAEDGVDHSDQPRETVTLRPLYMLRFQRSLPGALHVRGHVRQRARHCNPGAVKLRPAILNHGARGGSSPM